MPGAARDGVPALAGGRVHVEHVELAPGGLVAQAEDRLRPVGVHEVDREVAARDELELRVVVEDRVVGLAGAEGVPGVGGVPGHRGDPVELVGLELLGAEDVDAEATGCGRRRPTLRAPAAGYLAWSPPGAECWLPSTLKEPIWKVIVWRAASRSAARRRAASIWAGVIGAMTRPGTTFAGFGSAAFVVPFPDRSSPRGVALRETTAAWPRSARCFFATRLQQGLLGVRLSDASVGTWLVAGAESDGHHDSRGDAHEEDRDQGDDRPAAGFHHGGVGVPCAARTWRESIGGAPRRRFNAEIGLPLPSGGAEGAPLPARHPGSPCARRPAGHRGPLGLRHRSRVASSASTSSS